MTSAVVHREPKVDAYVAKAAPFARPILATLRDVVHAACRDVEEHIKWGVPHFVYRGGNLCHMAAFKAHCAFGFWRGKEIEGLPADVDGGAMSAFGRIGSLDDLPPRRELTRWIRAAMKLNDAGTPVRGPRVVRAALPMPDDFAAALASTPKARAAFDGFTPGAQRDYVEWITEAKREATRASRIVTAIEWIADGKDRHWKYR